MILKKFIRLAANVAEVYRDNLILIKRYRKEDYHTEDDNYFPDDEIYPITETNDKESKKKSLSEQLIEENDEYMDDIFANLDK
jgi:hypothetical protein